MARHEPQSPCSRSCTLDSNDICPGYYRTLEEIVSWSNYSAEEKWTVLEKLEERKQERGDALARVKGGR